MRRTHPGSPGAPVHPLAAALCGLLLGCALLATPAFASPPTYTVRSGDTLLGIALRHELTLSEIRQLNGLRGDRIRPGQELIVGRDHNQETTHVVVRGENLRRIAREHDTTVEALRELNGLRGDRILVGQELRLRDAPEGVHVVEEGDVLWQIAQAHMMSVHEIKAINGLVDDRIRPGQRLRIVRPGRSEPRRSRYVVKRGDTLGEIALLHRMSVRELREWNELRGSVIHPGQQLEVRPVPGLQLLEPDEVPWDRLDLRLAGVPRHEAGNGPYFFRPPHAGNQRGNEYREKVPGSPLSRYREARELWEAFEQQVGRMGRLSRDLEGWHIVLDPGHGGIDPGSIAACVDGRGETVYVVEDEYVYDIMLRSYVLLRLHGAEVTPTLLSPNHLIRGNQPATQTFVHERNEVYNLESINRSNGDSAWPRGGRTGLARRVQVAAVAFDGVPSDHRLFVSLHADNTPASAKAASVLYYERPGHSDHRSRRLAAAMLPALGAGSFTKGRRLGVLRDNPAHAAVLVELRNLAYTDHAWALRFEELRQRDAEKVVQGLLDYARGRHSAGASR